MSPSQDMHLSYGLAEGNARSAERGFHERYQQRDLPDHYIFPYLHHNLCRPLPDNRHSEVCPNDPGKPWGVPKCHVLTWTERKEHSEKPYLHRKALTETYP
ncbi:hypothetical protein TNCV_2330391 [Trichonephila clavipes]|nr:hypothetical protein TNCV_2330391 [Trichonephila clavipes]